MEMKKNVDTNLGITIILVISALFVICDFIYIGNELGWDLGFKSRKNSNNVVEKIDVGTQIISDDKDNTQVIEDENRDMTHYVISDDFSYADKYNDRTVLDSDMNIRTVKDQIVLTGDYYGSLSVDNGKLNLNINRYFFDPENRITYIDTSFEPIYLSHSFEGENVKYIYHDYFMPSADHVIWVLTDAGNVYFNTFNFYHSDFNTDFFDKFEKKYSNVSDLKLVEKEPENGIGLAIVVNGEPIEISKWDN